MSLADVWFEIAWFLNRRLCGIFGHQWKHWEGGHVYAGDDWDGPWHDGHPWSYGFKTCRRCGAQENL